MSVASTLKDKLIAHATEAVFAIVGTVIPAYLFLVEDRLSQLLRQTSPEWLVRTFALLLAIVFWLIAWLFYRRNNLRFIEELGVYMDLKTRFHVCPHCHSEKKRSFLKNESRGYRCTVCRYYFEDPKRRPKEEPPKEKRPHGWMAR